MKGPSTCQWHGGVLRKAATTSSIKSLTREKHWNVPQYNSSTFEKIS